MLLEIRDYLQREKTASDQQMAREFGLDISALNPMLDLWLRKGVIESCSADESPGTTCRSRCFKCHTLPPVYYQFCKK